MMTIKQLNFAPTVSYAPAPMPAASFNLAPAVTPKLQSYTVTVVAEFEIEDEARAFVRDVLSINGYKPAEIE